MEVVQKIDRHLEFSREYQNIGSHQPVWQPVAQMIARAVSDLAHEGTTILMQVEPVEIYADPLSVKVFYNLLENALRHGDTITQIRVSSEKRPDGELVLMFEDNGAGVRDEDKDRIFQVRFRETYRPWSGPFSGYPCGYGNFDQRERNVGTRSTV